MGFERPPGWASRIDSLAWIARLLLAGGTAAICLVSLIEARLPAAFDSATAPALIGLAISAAGLLVAFIALAELGWCWTWAPLAAFWGIGLAAAGPTGFNGSTGLTGWVPAGECLVLACAALLLVAKPGTRAEAAALAVLVLASAAVLILFGAIHWSNAPDIAALIPGWIPARDSLPFVTSSIMFAAAVAILVPLSRRVAAAAIALMFASWIPLVHAPRLLAEPTSSSEWEFVLMAACLTGAMLTVATRGSKHRTTALPPFSWRIA
jgi:uncharacterized membrane protein